MTCMFDRDDECTCSCLDCVRYQPNECCECGATKSLKRYEDGEYYCPDCLAAKLIGETDGVIAMFLDRNVESFAAYLEKVC